MTLKKGDRVYQYYACEPSIIYGSGKSRDEGTVLSDPIEYDGKLFIAVIFDHRRYPELYLVGNVQLVEEKK